MISFELHHALRFFSINDLSILTSGQIPIEHAQFYLRRKGIFL